MTTTFARLGLPDSLVSALAQTGIVDPFPIQAATIPDALEGNDVSGRAPTGSGKTLAFGLPVLTRLAKAKRNRPKALILAPTRELAEQIKAELAPLARAVDRHVLAVYGGVGYGPQKGALRKGVDLLVATPGRLEDLMDQGVVDLGETTIAVIDEADRMADMGFLPAVRRILDQTARHRQTLLFSATLDGDVAVLSRDYQREPIRHDAESVGAETAEARHHFWLVEHQDRVRHTAEVVAAGGRSIVFTRTRRGADRLAKQLSRHGLGAVALHGGRSQNQRNRALRSFSTGRAQALVATDVAARGIHIEAVASVVHFDPPADSKDYLHRSGRTARAGAAGTVVSLVTRDQKKAVRRMQHQLDLDDPIESPRMDDLDQNVDRPERGPRIGSKQAVVPGRVRPATKTPARVEPDGRGAGAGGPSVYVANLPWGATREDLSELFGRYGEVDGTTIITDNRTGRSKGFGFVDMPKRAGRDAAIRALHGSMLDGRDLTVRMARPRRYHS